IGDLSESQNWRIILNGKHYKFRSVNSMICLKENVIYTFSRDLKGTRYVHENCVYMDCDLIKKSKTIFLLK
ncbi:hypothetical protein L9F63_023965, partial [Diploptera punctata]